MRGRPATGWRKTAKVRAVEAEFEMPFWKVVEGFALDGYGKQEVGRILGWHEDAFLRLLKQHDPGIEWPEPTKTRGYLEKRYEFTDNRRAVAMRNLGRMNGAEEDLRRLRQSLAGQVLDCEAPVIRQARLPALQRVRERDALASG